LHNACLDNEPPVHLGRTPQRPPTAVNHESCSSGRNATTEAAEDPEIESVLAAGVRSLGAEIEGRLRLAREKGELKKNADPEALGMLASATLHTIAIRARAELRRIARKAVKVICG
jgi:hypothetical protein